MFTRKKKEIKPITQIEEEEDDYPEFDFSIYEAEAEDSEDDIEDISRIPRREFAATKSKYSPHFLGLERLERIRVDITRCSIKIAGNTQDIKDFWDIYGALNEYWANIKDLTGRSLFSQVDEIFDKMSKRLIQLQNLDNIEYKNHEMILKLRDKIYIISQRLGFSFEVDFKNSSFMAKAKRGIKD